MEIRKLPDRELWEVVEGEEVLGQFSNPDSAAYAADQYIASNRVKGGIQQNLTLPTHRSTLKDIFGEG